MSKPIRYLFILLLCLFVVACNSLQLTQTEPDTSPDSGRILLWHGWNEAETRTLKEILTKFKEIYPNVQVISAAVAPEQLLQRYKNTATQGLGPDLLIGPSEWVRELANAKLLQAISQDVSETELYLPYAVESLRDHSQKEQPAPLYGLPLSLQPVALYYNPNLVSTPATTLDDLLAQAANGQRVAFNTNFDEAFWGIQAFGGTLFDEEGRVILDQGGFANWLAWLKSAQDAPGMILTRDDTILRNLFIEKDAAYYIAGPQLLPILEEAFEQTDIGVAPLPQGPNGAAGPFLNVEAIMFNPASSVRQRELALTLGGFLTNPEQSRTLMRETERIPANQRVRIDANAYPLIDAFARQARTAVPIPNFPQMAQVRQFGNDAYTQVLLGVTEITTATYNLTNQVNEAAGFSVVEAPDQPCVYGGRLRLWHSLSGQAAMALEQLSRNFMRNCPAVIVQLSQFSEEELVTTFINGPPPESRPTLLLTNSASLLRLTEANQEATLIAPITNELDTEVQQRFIPAATQALQYDNNLFGLPLSLDFVTLYYKTEDVTIRAVTLDELLSQAAAGQEVILPNNFEQAFWGIPAFGGTLFDEQYRLILEELGLIEWLTWLEEANDLPGIHLEEPEEALAAFLSDDDDKNAAYYVGPISALNDIQAALGAENLGVAPLPSGAVGEAKPLLRVESFLFPAFNEMPAELALAFATYATTAENQSLLMQQAQRLPANVKASTTDNALMQALLLQAQKVIVPPNVPQMETVSQLGHSLYTDFLLGEQTAAQAACQFSKTVNETNGFTVEASDLPSACVPASEQ